MKTLIALCLCIAVSTANAGRFKKVLSEIAGRTQEPAVFQHHPRQNQRRRFDKTRLQELLPNEDATMPQP